MDPAETGDGPTGRGISPQKRGRWSTVRWEAGRRKDRCQLLPAGRMPGCWGIGASRCRDSRQDPEGLRGPCEPPEPQFPVRTISSSFPFLYLLSFQKQIPGKGQSWKQKAAVSDLSDLIDHRGQRAGRPVPP